FARIRAGNAERRLSFGLAERRAALGRLAKALRAAEAEVIAALADDFGKPPAEVLLTELLPLLDEIAVVRRNLARWMRPRRVRAGLSGFGTRARLAPEPRGTALILAPWNYPLLLTLSPLVAALAAGNGAVLKPSELAPATAALIARLVAETFPPDLVAVVQGDADTARALLALPFDHVFFTGSPRVGALVMEAAAKVHASVTLELGGKSPAIVGPGADIARAADWVAFGKFVNAGQTCVAPDHLFVHESLHAPFFEALRARIARAYGGAEGSRQLARIISPRHAERLRALLAEAEAHGARRLEGGRGAGRVIPPTLIEGVGPETGLGREEIFGPILPIHRFSDIDAVIDRINAGPKPLALYIFERDRALIDRVRRATSSGGVGVNITLQQAAHPHLPFGGVGMSGFGASRGEAGFRAFSHERAVLENRFSPLPWLFPPYTAGKRRLIGWLMRLLG
ncbi:MAG: aldehyde dehydrogenase family protein, partial [Alphaproteobacteria bacterium]